MGLLARRRATRRPLLDVDLEEDPLALLVNFFDCALVLALAFLVAAEMRRAAAAGDPVTDQRERLERFRATTTHRTGPGQRLGVAYRLEDGQVVYVPEAGAR
jgi:hypothetical protein